MSKKEIAEKSRKAFEKASRGKFSSRPISAEQRKQYQERIARLRSQRETEPARRWA